MPLYEKYASIRDAKGVTDYWVSKESGVATATLTSWKQGVYTPKLDKILLIASVLDVPLEALLEE